MHKSIVLYTNLEIITKGTEESIEFAEEVWNGTNTKPCTRHLTLGCHSHFGYIVDSKSLQRLNRLGIDHISWKLIINYKAKNVLVHFPLLRMLHQILDWKLLIHLKLIKLFSLKVSEIAIYKQMSHQSVSDEHLAHTNCAAPVHVRLVWLEPGDLVRQHLFKESFGLGIT